METARLVWSYLHMLGRRPDLHWDDAVERSGQQPAFALGSGLDAESAAQLADRVPADMLAFYRHFNGGGFYFDGLYFGGPGDSHGGLDLSPLVAASFETYVYGDEPWELGASWMMQNVNDEWYANLVCDPGKTTAEGYVAFYANVDAELAQKFESFDAYLRAGARSGLVFMWQAHGYPPAEAALDALLKASASPGTEAAMAAALVDRWGITPSDAASLVGWLGDRAVLLLPSGELPASAPGELRAALAEFDQRQAQTR